MKIVKKWIIQLGANFNWILTQIENHEALVDSAINEMKSSRLNAVRQLGRIENDGKKLKQKLVELNNESELWKSRALSIHEKDRNRALECIKRQKITEKQISYLEVQSLNQQKLEKGLSEDLSNLDLKLEELKRKKNEYTAREARGEILESKLNSEMSIIGEIDDIFERWDSKIAESESFKNLKDSFEDQFLIQEEAKELEESLDQLIGSN